MTRTSLLTLLCVAAALGFQRFASAAGTVYNVPPNSLAPLYDGNAYRLPEGVRVNVLAAEPVAYSNFYVEGGELYYDTPGGSFLGPHGIGVSGGGSIEFHDGFSENLQITAGGVGKVLGGFIPNALVNEGHLDILGVEYMWLTHLQGSVNLSAGQVPILDLGEFGFGVPITQPAILNQTGGVLGEDFFRVFDGGVANISGGSFGPASSSGSIAVVGSGGVVNLIVASMEVDGMPLSGLSPDVATELTDRDVDVSGLLASGDPFAFRITTDFNVGTLIVEPGGQLMITLAIPEPTTLVIAVTCATVASLRRRPPAQWPTAAA
jgi:hypothetical protein